MANEKVYTYRNAGTENSPLWEKYFNRTIADGVQMGADDPTTIKEYVDNRLSLLSDEIDDLKENGLNQNIDEAVANYLSENPISGGLTSTAKNLLITILRNSLYSNNQSENITALETALGQSSSDTTVYYSITNTLTNVTNNNSNTQVLENTSYIASLSANNGYTLESITVTMGGIDITSSVYADGVITIERISGNVEIIANAVEGSTEVVDSLPTDGLLGYWDMRNMTEPEVKDWHWAYPSNEGNGGLYASVAGGSKGTQSLPTYNEYGTTSSFGIMRDSASYPGTVEFGTEFTFVILTHGNIPGTTANCNNGISPSNISPNWRFTVDYYKTDGSNIRISELGSGNNDDVTDYNFIVKRVNNENLKIVLDTSECDLTGTDYEDFSYWNQYVQPSPYMTASIVAFALYDRALTDVEIEDARGFFKTLEVA